MDIKKLTEAISKTLNEKIKPIKAIEPTEEEKAFLDDMARKIENEEGISYAELSNLQSLQSQIVWLGDVKLAEWSGIPEEVWNISCIDESLNSDKKVMKEEMEYKRKIWDIFEENIAEYLNEHGVKPEGNNVMNYISKNAVEIVKAVLEKEYNYEEDDQAIFELYYNCPIHFTYKAQAIDKLLEEYLAESLKRCLTIEDKLIQISSLDKNESVTDKKAMKESVGVSDIDDLAKDYFQPYMTYDEYKNGKHNAYMVWNTDLVYISEGGAKSEIIGASSKRELKGKIAAIRTYEYEKQYGRNEQVEPPTLASTKGLFKK